MNKSEFDFLPDDFKDQNAYIFSSDLARPPQHHHHRAESEGNLRSFSSLQEFLDYSQLIAAAASASSSASSSSGSSPETSPRTPGSRRPQHGKRNGRASDKRSTPMRIATAAVPDGRELYGMSTSAPVGSHMRVRRPSPRGSGHHRTHSEPVLCVTPAKERPPEQQRYAGGAFANSPPPESLPIPAFFQQSNHSITPPHTTTTTTTTTSPATTPSPTSPATPNSTASPTATALPHARRALDFTSGPTTPPTPAGKLLLYPAPSSPGPYQPDKPIAAPFPAPRLSDPPPVDLTSVTGPSPPVAAAGCDLQQMTADLRRLLNVGAP